MLLLIAIILSCFIVEKGAIPMLIVSIGYLLYSLDLGLIYVELTSVLSLLYISLIKIPEGKVQLVLVTSLFLLIPITLIDVIKFNHQEVLVNLSVYIYWGFIVSLTTNLKKSMALFITIGLLHVIG